ncbi:hypothetical protein [Streptomyces flavofungini]|uniref:hypothetical protein n=1 Tax=Streptomyces flavofungini TaxID=68200 RepID=UPI0025B24A35|nr:hypothetical protein [Streptomyces flavofungini]WJV44675.1 hypothetical protein QUY26_03520 [Streptomyces flavofungini]
MTLTLAWTGGSRTGWISGSAAGHRGSADPGAGRGGAWPQPSQSVSIGVATVESRVAIRSVVSAALAAAFGITGAPIGDAEVYDPAGGVLPIVAQRGFHHLFLTSTCS